MRHRLAAAAILTAAVATIPVAALNTAHAKAGPPAPITVSSPWCAQSEDSCRLDYVPGTGWRVVPIVP